MSYEPGPEEVDALYDRLHRDAESSGYHLNPDAAFTKAIVRSLLINQERYGYWACPCRLASRKKEEDLDIICPCDYRDPDLGEYGCCYCSLYVTKKVLEGKMAPKPIPERRPPKGERKANAKPAGGLKTAGMPVWRCRVCGYLCARDEPPDECPICKAKKERFERFV